MSNSRGLSRRYGCSAGKQVGPTGIQSKNNGIATNGADFDATLIAYADGVQIDVEPIRALWRPTPRPAPHC